MSCSGVAVRTCRMLQRCFLAVDTTDLRSAKSRAPSRVPETPEIFILTFIIRRSCSARLLVKGTSRIGEETQRFGFELLQPVEQIVAGTLFAASASLRLRLQRGQPAMIRQAHSDRRPIAIDEGVDLLGRERPLSCFPRRARTASLASRSVARMSSAQGSFSNSIRPTEFAQDMGVAEGVDDLDEPVVRLEVVVNDDAAFQIPGNVAALFSGAIEGEAKARSRVQPLQLAADPIARLVEMANLLAGDALADPLVDRRPTTPSRPPSRRRSPNRPEARRICRSSSARSDPRGSTAGRSDRPPPP